MSVPKKPADEAEDLYRNVEFYEKVDGELVGPLEGIRFIKPAGRQSVDDTDGYSFCQLKDGKIVRVYTEDEIEVVNKSMKQ